MQAQKNLLNFLPFSHLALIFKPMGRKKFFSAWQGHAPKRAPGKIPPGHLANWGRYFSLPTGRGTFPFRIR
jgi:hypothetical protein